MNQVARDLARQIARVAAILATAKALRGSRPADVISESMEKAGAEVLDASFDAIGSGDVDTMIRASKLLQRFDEQSSETTPATIFGIPVQADPSLPRGVFEFRDSAGRIIARASVQDDGTVWLFGDHAEASSKGKTAHGGI